MADITWIAGQAGQASDGTKWSLGRAPQNGDRVIWGPGSSNNCSWDLDKLTVRPDGWVVKVGYGGTISQGNVDIGLGAGGYDQDAGTVNGNLSRHMDNLGPFDYSGGEIGTNLLNVRMSGDGKHITAFNSSAIYLQALDIKGNTTIDVGVTARTRTWTIDAGKVLTNNGSIRHVPTSSYSIGNSGLMDGTGLYYYLVPNIETTLNFGAINCSVEMELWSGNGSDNTITLAASHHFGGSLYVHSSSATYTLTLHHGTNYSLEVEGETHLGVRGKMTQGTAPWYFNGGYNQDGASSVFNQGAADVYVGAAGFSYTAGTFNGNINRWLHCDGPYSAPSVGLTVYSLNVEMTRDGSAFSGNVSYFGTLKFSANTNYDAVNGLSYTRRLEVAPGKSVNIALGKTLCLYSNVNGIMAIDNQGSIDGLGTLEFLIKLEDPTFALGEISCRLYISGHSGSTANRTLYLGANAPLTGVVLVDSQHATNTMSVHLNGRTLDAAEVQLSTRGQMTGAGTINAPVTVSVGDLNPTGEVSIMGLLTVSGGTLTQLSYDIHCYAGVSVTLGTVTGPTNYLYSFVLHNCNFIQSGGTVTGTTVSIKTIGDCTVTITGTICAIIATAGSIARKTTGNTISSRIETEAGAEIILSTTTELRYYASSTYVNLGRISAIGAATLQLSLYNGDKTIDFGDIRCYVRVRVLGVAIADQKLTLAAPVVSAPSIYMDSQHGSYKCIFDLAGFDNILGYVTVVGRARLIGNTGRTTYTGAWDTSWGEWDPMTGEVAQGGSGTAALAAGQSFYDFRAEVQPLSLASNVTIQHDYIHARDTVLNGYHLTLLQAEREVRLFDRASRHSAGLADQQQLQASITGTKRLRGQYGGS